ncbi:serine/threonine-protein phosphatase 7 long form homolog [Trifolium pratense]|uniref:serine/threonine-protein phosphatase 7 long form homolog n=1 Tax=Trifolium pratense TaxID=57577 RepID=UPI001E69676B|nr:serine/threonine-protein phosphatase 7 long form homolog [Trifolium pratense]
MIYQQSFKSTIMEVREDSMTSLVAHKEPTFRTAHFLKPIANSIHDELNLNNFNNLNPSSSSCPVFEPKEGSLKINFNGWCYPNPKWVMWVDQLKLKYESVWKKAGIFEAIMSTKSHIMKNQDLVYGVVEKWCSETNTFVFPFGEATITLEDVMVLGGYSLFGSPISKPLKDQEMKEVEKKLKLARSQLYKTKSGAPRTSLWMNNFIDCNDSEIEHEAFLATWLSIFVFPHKKMFVKSCLFPIAIHLARGNTIALGPSVLASLYKDLSLFKKQIVDLKKCTDKFPFVLDVNVQSPFYLVQVWVWERFKNLQPQPKLINNGDPLLLRWDMVKALKIKNVRLALDSATDYFIWRPYVRYNGMFYPNDEILLALKKDLDKKILSFVICLRVSELVGFECIEQYLPHRVAMQFGIDQDVPVCVPRLNNTKTIAWKNYCRPLSDTSLYFPSRFSKADVTTRYAKLWKRSASSTKCSPPNAEIPPDFPPPKLVGTVTFGKPCDYGSKTRKGDNIVDDDVPPAFFPTFWNTMPFENSVVEDCNHVLEDVQFNDGDENIETWFSNDKICVDIVADVPSRLMLSDNSLEDGLNAERNIDADTPSSLPPSDCQSEIRTENYSYLSEESIAEFEQRISRLERMRKELKKARLLH